MLTGIDYVIVVVYLIGIMLLGFYFKRFVHSSKDFFLAGKTLPFWAIGMSIVVSDIGALDFVGISGQAYRYGIAVGNFDWIGSAPAMLLVAFIFVPYFWKAGLYTIPEYLGRRYNEPVRVVAALGRAQALPVGAAAEHIEFVERWIAGLGGNALGVECLDKPVDGGVAEGPLVVVEELAVVPVPCATGVLRLRGDALDLGEGFIEEGGVVRTDGGLHVEAGELLKQDGPLPFAEAIVAAVDEVGVIPLAGHATAVVDRARPAFEVVEVGPGREGRLFDGLPAREC